MNSDLFKLVDPEDAPGVPAVGAHFLSKAGGVTQVLDGQTLRGNPLVSVVGGNWLLGSRDQVFLINGVLISLLTAFSNNLSKKKKK